MKHFTKTLIFALFAILALTNCESKSIPENLNSLPIKRYILLYSDGYYVEKMFDVESRIKKQLPPNYVPRDKYNDLRKVCEKMFNGTLAYFNDKSKMIQDLKKSLWAYGDYTDELKEKIKRNEHVDYKLIRLNENEQKQAEEICLNLINEFDSFFSDLAAKKLTLLDCIPDSKSKSKAFQAYWAIYESGSGLYILAYYTEFTNSNKYTLEIKYKGESLSELNAYLK